MYKYRSEGAENDGHKNAGREVDGPICRAFAGRENAGHEIAGQKLQC